MKHRKEFVRNSGFYVFLGFLPLGINVLLAPVYTFYLSPEDYGIIALAQMFFGAVSAVLGAGINQAYGRFYFDTNHDSQKKAALLKTAVLLICMSASLLYGGLLLVGDEIFAKLFNNTEFKFSNYGHIVFLTALASILVSVFQSFYRNEEKPARYGLLSLGFFLFSAGGILLGVIYFEAGAFGNILGRSLGSSLIALSLLFLLLFNRKVKLLIEQVKPMYKYGLPLVPYAVALMLFNLSDRWMVEHFFGLETLGFYNFAFVLASSTSVFIYAVYNAVAPKVLKLLTSREPMHGQLEEVRSILNLFGLSVIVFISLALACTPIFLEYAVAEEYRVILSYLGLLFLFYLFQVYYVIYTIPFHAEKRTKALPFIAILSLIIGVICYYGSIAYFGFGGVFIGLLATKITQVLSSVLVIKYSPKAFQTNYLNLGNLHLISMGSFLLGVLFFAMAYLAYFDYVLAYYLTAAGMIVLGLVVYQKRIPALIHLAKKMMPNLVKKIGN